MQIYEFAFAAVHQTMCQTYNVSYITLSDWVKESNSMD